MAILVEPWAQIRAQGTAFDREYPLICSGHVPTIFAFANHYTALTADDSWVITYGCLGLRPKKPVWWDTRLSRWPEARGKNSVVQNAILMFRDIKEWGYWGDQAGPAMRVWLADKNSKVKRADLEEKAGYEGWCFHAIYDNARMLWKLARGQKSRYF